MEIWFKASSLFPNFLKIDITLFDSQLSMKGQNGSNGLVYLNFLKNDIKLFNSHFSLKKQHASNHVVCL